MGIRVNSFDQESLDSSKLPPPDRKLSSTDQTISPLALKSIVDLALTFEEAQTGQVSRFEEKSQSILDLIESLQKLSRLLPHEEEEITNEQEIRALLKTLKEKGISLIEDETKPLTRAFISQIKTMISSYQEQSRTQLQQNFTKMQTVVQNMQSVMDTIKRMIDQVSELCRKILGNGKTH